MKMTKKQRFMAAMRGEPVDMVPASPLVHDRFAYQVLGRTGVDAMFEVHQMLGSIHHREGGSVGVHIHLPSGWGRDDQVVEESREGGTVHEASLHTPFGTLTSRSVVGRMAHDPTLSQAIDYFVKKPEDWEVYIKYTEQELAGAGEAHWDGYVRNAELMREEAAPCAWAPPTFCQLMQMRGMQQILYDLYDCPELLEQALETRRALSLKVFDALAQSPAELIMMDICWATGAGMGPQLFEQWVLPDVVQAVEVIKSIPAKCFGLYTLGRVRNLLPMLVDAGVDFIETFEPNEGDITLAEAKQLYGGRVCLVGNFDCVVLSFGDMEDARQETLRCLHEGMAGGRYVLATADEVPADAKMDNLKAMVETVEEHGRYD